MKSFFRNFRYSTLLVSILCMGLGALVLLKPDNTMKVLTYGFGGVLVLAGIIQVVAYLLGERKLLYHGFMDIKYGFDIKGCQAKGAAMAVFFGVATCAVGVLMLVDPFKSEGALLTVAGLGFLFDGITDFITVFTLAGAKVHYDRLQSAAPVIELEPGAAHTVHVDGNTAETPVLSQPEADAGTAEPEDVPAAEPVVVTAPAEDLPAKPAPEE